MFLRRPEIHKAPVICYSFRPAEHMPHLRYGKKLHDCSVAYLLINSLTKIKVGLENRIMIVSFLQTFMWNKTQLFRLM